ncbi:PREDICTED: transcription elongation factor 1 homolog [Nicrophorus vespilloides]|uniref:Transcription elongation factor 1 homolog n=1 Tax=Nicrophorus vespilloides TaxID=110193 RepID=A0ABM1N797_NICVS|nr:PREDICTED: transcription elongation factor 1 homolog [Nicrophorus vespilloides]
MGRRKSKRQAPTRRKAIEPLDQQFNCPFCNHEQSCEVKMDKGRNTAKISCRVCKEDFQTNINILYDPIDVYNDWIDACELAN